MVKRLLLLSLLSAPVFAEQFTIDMLCIYNDNAPVQKTVHVEENNIENLSFDGFNVALEVVSFDAQEVTVKTKISTMQDNTEQIIAIPEFRTCYGVPATLTLGAEETGADFCMLSLIANKS